MDYSVLCIVYTNTDQYTVICYLKDLLGLNITALLSYVQVQQNIY